MLADVPYAVLAAAVIAVAAFTGSDEPVFLTSCAADTVSVFTKILFVRTGRETGINLAVSACCAVADGGKLVGRLDVVLTNRSRPWADNETTEKQTANKAQTDRQTIFLKNIKLNSNYFIFVGREQGAVNCSPTYKRIYNTQSFPKFQNEFHLTNLNCDP